MARIDPALKSKLQLDPNAQVRLILQCQDDPSQHVTSVQARGLTVRHVYTLMNGIAVEGKASNALQLADEPWVTSVEEDRPIHTM